MIADVTHGGVVVFPDVNYPVSSLLDREEWFVTDRHRGV